MVRFYVSFLKRVFFGKKWQKLVGVGRFLEVLRGAGAAAPLALKR
jgi:hypothetical protein